MKTTETTITKKNVNVKTSLLSALIAAACAVALPQLIHVFGAVTGLGTLPGETFLPMHLPVMVCGFLAGPVAGLVAGAASPAISTALTGMPVPAMMPFMMIELAAYGLFAGLLKGSGGDDASSVRYMIPKVLAVQILGRAVRAVAILIAFYGLGMKMIAPPMIWNSIIAGIPGLLIQLALIPVIVKAVDMASDR